MNEAKNMELWNKVCNSDPQYVKQVSFGRKFSTVDAQSQIMKATEVWGEMGANWGVKDEVFTVFNQDSDKPFATYQAKLWVIGQDGYLAIHSDIPLYTKRGYNEDWTKKMATDALTKGLSRKGMNADLFLGQWDSQKYQQEMKEKFADQAKQMDTVALIREIGVLYRELVPKGASGKKYHDFHGDIDNKNIAELKGFKSALQKLEGEAR